MRNDWEKLTKGQQHKVHDMMVRGSELLRVEIVSDDRRVRVFSGREMQYGTIIIFFRYQGKELCAKISAQIGHKQK